MGVHLTKKTTKPYRWIALTLPKTLQQFYVPDQDKLHFPAFFSKSTQREHIYYLNFSNGFSGSNYYNTLPTAPFIQTLESDKRRCYYFRDQPWASIVHFKLLRCFKLLLVSKLRVWCFAMVTIPRYPKWRWLTGEGPFVAGIFGFGFVTVPNHSQMKVTWVKAFPSYSAKDDCFALHWLVGFKIQLTWYFLSEHGSETHHEKDQSLARSSEVRVYLWSACSGVVTDTLTLFR